MITRKTVEEKAAGEVAPALAAKASVVVGRVRWAAECSVLGYRTSCRNILSGLTACRKRRNRPGI